MTNKIGGYGNRPVHNGADKTVSRERDASTSASKGAEARQLAALERAVNEAPVTNEARVASIRLAIEEGRYEVSPERIAAKLLRMEHELRMTEK